MLGAPHHQIEITPRLPFPTRGIVMRDQPGAVDTQGMSKQEFSIKAGCFKMGELLPCVAELLAY
jgi:hypothetical protein